MIGTVYVLAGIIVVFGILGVYLIRLYIKTKNKPSLYLGITSLFYILTAFFGILIAVVTPMDNSFLAKTFYRLSTTSGISGYLFLNMFAMALTKREIKRMIWMPLTLFLIINSIVWISEPVEEGIIEGTTEFALTSMYKPPYGMPIVETIIVLMAILDAYPIYLFLSTARKTPRKIIRVKSFLMGLGLLVAGIGYIIEVTDAIHYVYMPIYRSMIFVGSFLLCFGYAMPKRIANKIVGGVSASPNSVEYIMEKFLMPTVTPGVSGNRRRFSKTLGMNHQQIRGRKILLEFDPASNYEKPIRDFISEALANKEQAFVFTRRGGTLHSSLSRLEGVKFFCLTQQTSVPKEVSESEVLLPSTDVSLMLNVFNKMLEAQPEGVVNIVFDNLSDLVLSIGFEKAYQFLKYATEILASSRVTAIFLLNKVAHDVKIASSIRSLFSDQISFEKEGMQTVKLLEKEFVAVDLEEATKKR
jgi:hypothetical protein